MYDVQDKKILAETSPESFETVTESLFGLQGWLHAAPSHSSLALKGLQQHHGVVGAGLITGSYGTISSCRALGVGVENLTSFRNSDTVAVRVYSQSTAVDGMFDMIVQQLAGISGRQKTSQPRLAQTRAANDGSERVRSLGRLYLQLEKYRAAGKVNDAVVHAGRAILENHPGRIPYPTLSSSQDGELGLSWHRGDDRIEAMIDPQEKRFYWIGKFAGKFVEGDDQDLPVDMPRSLMGMLARLFG